MFQYVSVSQAFFILKGSLSRALPKMGAGFRIKIIIGGALSVANIGIAIRFSTNIVNSGVSSHFILYIVY